MSTHYHAYNSYSHVDVRFAAWLRRALENWRIPSQFSLGFDRLKPMGGCPGYITSISMIPKHKIAVVVLTNAGDGPAGRVAQNVLKTIGSALQKTTTPSKGEQPDFSIYLGNYESRPWGGEVAIRQWGDRLVAINIPSDDLSKALTKLKHVSGHEFIRLTDDGEPREAWVFEMGDGNKTQRILRHSSYSNRIE